MMGAEMHDDGCHMGSITLPTWFFVLMPVFAFRAALDRVLLAGVLTK